MPKPVLDHEQQFRAALLLHACGIATTAMQLRLLCRALPLLAWLLSWTMILPELTEMDDKRFRKE
jgi:hypothetical protein